MTKSEQARADASHACDACGGAGGDHWVVRYWHDGQPVFELGFSDEATARREQDYLDRAGWGRVTCSPVETPSPCPVCRGAGRISDRMPAADALADAETLLLAHPFIGRGRVPYTWQEAIRFAHAAFQAVPALRDVSGRQRALAAKHGDRAIRYGIEPKQPYQAYWRTVLAARAAFRAVPGLRGE